VLYCGYSMWRRIHHSKSSCSTTAFGSTKRHESPTTVCSRTGRIVASDGSLFQVVVGLEIHAVLQVPTKLFSSAPLLGNASPRLPYLPTTTTTAPNSAIHPFDVALPGSLPVLQRSSIAAAVCAAAALECTEICEESRFERKHYVYADLPHGYQITQQRWPLARHGTVTLKSDSGPNEPTSTKSKHRPPQTTITDRPQHVRIRRIQLEQDTGKTTTVGQSRVRVDMNRAGAPLIEIVTEPDIRSSADAVQIVQAIRQRLQFCRVCDGRMELGHFRIDGNVNVVPIEQLPQQDATKRPSSSALTELKNLNSLAQLQSAIDYEARRHADELLDSLTIDSPVMRPQTRTWIDDHTEFLRFKDDENDYRFMPEPDLPPLILSQALGMPLEEFLRLNFPELPEAAVTRLSQDYKIPVAKAQQLVNDPAAVEYLEKAMGFTSHGLVVANWISNELTGLLNADNERSISESPIEPTQLAELANMLHDRVISSSMAKNLIETLYETPNDFASVREAAKHLNLVMITDAQTLGNICRSVIAAHPEEMEVYRKGGKFKTKITKLLTGKAMAESKGNAQPERLQEILSEILEGSC
jgi:aspartyl-tRNA(Asn)/glutamyl-tRNA(Gln) amidotransferase subunit B